LRPNLKGAQENETSIVSSDHSVLRFGRLRYVDGGSGSE
jgi:hypothetical protein